MLRSDTLFRNSFYLLLSTATMAGFGFIFWLLAAHFYSPSDVGIASTLISAMSFISYLALLGFNTTFIRFLPRSKNRSQQIDTGLLLVLLAGVLVAGLYALFVPVISPRLHILHEHWYYAASFVLLVAFSAVNLVTDSIFIAYRSSVYNFIVDGLVSSIVQVSLPIALVGLGAFGIFAASGLGIAIAMLVSILLLVKKFNYIPKIKLHKQTLKEVIKFSSSSYISNIFNILPILLLPLIIINKLGTATAGYYYLAFMMANLLYSISYALAQSVLAEGSYAETSFRFLAKKSAAALGIVMVPASALLGLLGPFVLKLFGQDYSANDHTLILIFALSGPFVAAYIFGNTMLRILKKNRQIIFINAFYAATISGLAYVLAGKGIAWIGLAWLLGNALSALLIGMFFYFGRYAASGPDQP